MQDTEEGGQRGRGGASTWYSTRPAAGPNLQTRKAALNMELDGHGH